MTDSNSRAELHWHCKFCGDDELVESPDYSLGDKEPCTTCGEGVAHVMTLVEAAAYEASIARGEREPERAYT